MWYQSSAVPFSTLSSPDQSPVELIKAGFYPPLAIPFKGGPWRDASMALLQAALSTKPQRGRHQNITLKKGVLKKAATGLCQSAVRQLKERKKSVLKRLPDSEEGAAAAETGLQLQSSEERAELVSALGTAQTSKEKPPSSRKGLFFPTVHPDGFLQHDGVCTVFS